MAQHKHKSDDTITRIHKDDDGIPSTPIHGLAVKPFDWQAWDAGCHAKGICQGYSSVATHDSSGSPCAKKELHHRDVRPDLVGIADAYWQCPHCRQLQTPIQWAQGARLETYYIANRGHRTILWLQVSSGQWFVLVTKAYRSIQAVASYSGDCGAAYVVGNYPPQQMPDGTSMPVNMRRNKK